MTPAMVRPFPTPAPSPIKYAARSPPGRKVSCCCDASGRQTSNFNQNPTASIDWATEVLFFLVLIRCKWFDLNKTWSLKAFFSPDLSQTTLTLTRLFKKKKKATWAAYVMASNCNADRQPRSVTSSGMDTRYQTSGGLTLDRELVSTTGSGCRSPIFTEITKPLVDRLLHFFGSLWHGDKCLIFERCSYYFPTLCYHFWSFSLTLMVAL